MLNERLLSEWAGWQVMKHARVIHSTARVKEAVWTPPNLSGIVQDGDNSYRAGLRATSRTDVENLCTCRDSRLHGTMCAHTVAVALEVLKPTPIVSATDIRVAPKKKESRGPKFLTDSGNPLAFHLIFPPNIGQAWDKGQINVQVECVYSGKRILASALAPTDSFRVSPEDHSLSEKLVEWSGDSLAGMLALTREQFSELLGLLEDHPNISFGRKAEVRVYSDGIQPRLMIEKQPDGGMVLRSEALRGQLLLASTGAWLWREHSFHSVAPGLPNMYHALLVGPVPIPAAGVEAFLRRELHDLGSFFELPDDLPLPPDDSESVPALIEVAETEDEVLEKPAFYLKIEGSLNHLEAELELRRGRNRTTITTPGWQSDPAAIPALDRLKAAGFTTGSASAYVLKGEPKILGFFARDLPRMQRDWTVQVGTRFQQVTKDISRISAKLDVRASGENWFDLSYEIATPEGDRFSASEIQRLLQTGQNTIRLKNGRRAVLDPEMLDEFSQVVRDCDPQQRQPGVYRLDKRYAGFVAGAAEQTGASLKASAKWNDWANAQRNMDRLEPVPLGELDAIMRPYQRTGVYWMHFLSQNGFGGILADEMGLGKTLQTLAFLRHTGGRSLVVCPSSLVTNWHREAARWTPELKGIVIVGTGREKALAKANDYDILITSYPLLRRDAERYREIDFNTIVLDEAQHIKNPETQNAQAALSLRAKNRFVLTGTPVENSVRDLWSVTEFLMPGFLGTLQDFKDRFEKPISTNPGGPEQKRLAARLRPFIMRRLKKDVAADLPDKIEQVAWCELSGKQAALYADVLAQTRRTVSDLASEKDKGKARIMALTALLRLRQICCDPRLVGVEPTKEQISAKIELFEELISEAVDGGHRILVFSQFVGMLKLLRAGLEKADMPYCYLDGSTKARQAEVDRFQQGNTPVFLISLKAGGVGLNLAAADTVIHFDPWWNPAVEAQATDRAHRIGQKNVVTVYKLIVRGTVEEKILALQQKKRALVAATLESETPVMDGLTMNEIAELLE